MEIYRCKVCKATFPEVAWKYGQYIDTTNGLEEVHLSTVKNNPDQQEWAEARFTLSHTVRTPCCPRCHSFNIEKFLT